MLYQNIMQSEDTRLAKKVLQQQEEEDNEGSFSNEVKKLAKELNLMDVKKASKGELKKKIKEEITKKMQEEIEKVKDKSTKLRFISTPVEFKRAAYMEEYSGGSDSCYPKNTVTHGGRIFEL